MNNPFENYLAAVFMDDYHGDKDHYEDAFDGWLANLDVDELIEYANRAMRELMNQIHD